ncbi:unnamed protein product [Parnassius apollo]|uniref:(apollo) hypothetical protein n=1 Tax=Parnassius apollo TaxID=110799 RepID=A0A8S3WW96_PARAO|nr:unnamed protein product [Parnassius apollo]
MRKTSILLSFFVLLINNLVQGHLHLDWDTPNQALNQSLFEDVLDSEECRRQINFLRDNTLQLALFLDAGIRIPRGIFDGNTMDLGNYHQCLNINLPLNNTAIEGKYCMIRVPFNQELDLPNSSTPRWLNFNPSSLRMDEDVISMLKDYSYRRTALKALFGTDLNEIRSGLGNPLQYSVFRLAVCIPKPCTTQEAISELLFNISSIGFQYEDDYCRLPNDKPWVPADYTAM